MHLRIDRPARRELEHIWGMTDRVLKDPPSLALFIPLAASIGADDLGRSVGIPELKDFKLADDLQLEIDARERRPIKTELIARFEQCYRELPPPELSRFLVFCALRGAAIIRDKYLLNRR